MLDRTSNYNNQYVFKKANVVDANTELREETQADEESHDEEMNDLTLYLKHRAQNLQSHAESGAIPATQKTSSAVLNEYASHTASLVDLDKV